MKEPTLNSHFLPLGDRYLFAHTHCRDCVISSDTCAFAIVTFHTFNTYKWVILKSKSLNTEPYESVNGICQYFYVCVYFIEEEEWRAFQGRAGKYGLVWRDIQIFLPSPSPDQGTDKRPCQFSNLRIRFNCSFVVSELSN